MNNCLIAILCLSLKRLEINTSLFSLLIIIDLINLDNHLEYLLFSKTLPYLSFSPFVSFDSYAVFYLLTYLFKKNKIALLGQSSGRSLDRCNSLLLLLSNTRVIVILLSFKISLDLLFLIQRKILNRIGLCNLIFRLDRAIIFGATIKNSSYILNLSLRNRTEKVNELFNVVLAK